MRKILVPTDFSDCANAASEYAIQLANMSGAEINFLHLFSTPIDWVKLPKEKEKLYPEIRLGINNAKNQLNKLIIKAETYRVKTQQFLAFNEGNEEVLKHVYSHNHDFLVMGSHGAKGLREVLIGSNAQEILRNASVKVLIIKEPIVNPIRNIVFVSDFRDVSRASFHMMTQFAEIVEAHIDLLFVNTPDQFTESTEISQNMDSVMAHCNREDGCTPNVINAFSVEEGINNFIAEKPMDLIAICTHGKSGLEQLLSPSIAKKIANHTLLPLLSIKL